MRCLLHRTATADDSVNAECAILSVECPEGLGEGDALYVTTPDGVEIEVEVGTAQQTRWLSRCYLFPPYVCIVNREQDAGGSLRHWAVGCGLSALLLDSGVYRCRRE